MEDEFFEEEFETAYQLEVGIDDIYLMYHCVQETIKNGPGAAAVPVEEQQPLWALRDNLDRCMVDHKFHEM